MEIYEPSSFDVDEAVVRQWIRVQALKQPGVPVEDGLWQWPSLSERNVPPSGNTGTLCSRTIHAPMR